MLLPPQARCSVPLVAAHAGKPARPLSPGNIGALKQAPWSENASTVCMRCQSQTPCCIAGKKDMRRREEQEWWTRKARGGPYLSVPRCVGEGCGTFYIRPAGLMWCRPQKRGESTPERHH